MVASLLDIHVDRRPEGAGLISRDEVCNQSGIPGGFFLGYHICKLDLGMFCERGFDFADVDSEVSNLYPIIFPSQMRQ